MSGMGFKHFVWTKELDEQLLSEIAHGKNFVQLSISMNTSQPTISKRLKALGFYGLTDARRVMSE